MSKLIDLTGKQFGRWTVIKRGENTSRGSAQWICQCQCGTIKTIVGSSLRNGSSTSCGCYKIENSRTNNGKFVNEIGNRYGKLTVIAQDEELSKERHRAQWVCKCDCGNIITTSSKCLRDGKTKSCGCILSVGEENIGKILTEAGIRYKNQYGVSINNKWYRYDFAILSDEQAPIRFIEFDGIQHYDDNQLHWGKTSIEVQARDKVKNQYAKDHNIPLVRIPYKERDHITLEIILGNKYLIKEINNME